MNAFATPAHTACLLALLLLAALPGCHSPATSPSDSAPATSDASVDASVTDAPASDRGADRIVLGPDASLATAFGPVTTGTYIIGSSFAMGVRDLIQTFTKEAGMTVKVTEWSVGGASVANIWNDAAQSDPAGLQAKLKELKSGDYGLLFMNAQQPWLQTDTEVVGVGKFATEALSGAPGFRFLIQVYWTFEQDGYRFRETSTRWEDLMMYRFGALRVAYRVANTIKAPVFVAPVGEAIEMVKERAAKGDLAAFKSRAALHEADGQHLSALGNYVQASVIHSGAYQRKPHGQSTVMPGASGTASLSAADAKVIWDEVETQVRKTPFSGWYEKAPVTYAGYMAALKQAIRNWETFDNLPLAGAGSFTGEDGFVWSFTKGAAAPSAQQLIGGTLSLQADGSVKGTIPGGVGLLFFIFSPPGSGQSATVEVLVGGQLSGTFTRTQDNSKARYATLISDINAKGPVVLELRAKGAPCLLDNIQWTDSP